MEYKYEIYMYANVTALTVQKSIFFFFCKYNCTIAYNPFFRRVVNGQTKTSLWLRDSLLHALG